MSGRSEWEWAPLATLAGRRSARSPHEGASPLDGWERWVDRAVNVVPYIALLVSTALGLAVDVDPPGRPVAATLTASGLTLAWMLWMVTLHPQWQDRHRLMAVYFVVLYGLLGWMVWLSPFFGFFAFTGYLHAVYALRGRWRMAGIIGTAVMASASQVGGFQVLDNAGALIAFAVVLAFNSSVASVMASLGWVTHEQSERRKNTIDELAEANDRLVAALAENAGLHAQLLAQAREAGILDERQRMAQEIHDTIAQGLTGVVTQLEAAEQASQRPEDWQRHVRAAAALARESLTEARRSVQGLAPEPLASAQLPQALGDVLDRWSVVSGVRGELVTTGTAQPLMPEIEVTLLRTAQEALSNVAKHAAAERVALTLCYMEDLVTLDVRDDGQGFDPARLPERSSAGGFGLSGMRERIRRVGGTLEVEAEPGAGTAISACVPALLARSGVR